MTESPSRRPGAAPRPGAQRVLARIAITDTGYGTPCWLFQGALTSVGYGNVGSRVDDRNVHELAHRVVYAAAYGPIPAGLQLDHLCGTKACVSPTHLESVSPLEHGRREQLRRTGRVSSWLDASQDHVFTATRPEGNATVTAMRRSRATERPASTPAD